MRHFLIAEPIDGMLTTLTDALDRVDIGILLLDRNMRIRFANDRLTALFDLMPETLTRMPYYRDLMVYVGAAGRLALPPDQVDDFIAEHLEAVRNGPVQPTRIDLANGTCMQFSCKPCRDDGVVLTFADISAELKREAQEAEERVNAELRFNAEVLEDQGAYLAALAETADGHARQAELARLELENEIVQRRHLETELRRLATTDGLTGILNRPAFLAACQDVIERFPENERTIAALMLDVDHFKAINDQYGHAGGDRALQSLTKTLGSMLRDGDLFGRLGGEEFAILLDVDSPEHAEVAAEAMRYQVEESCLTFGGRQIRMTMSAGLAIRQATDRTVEQILARADAALYAAKRTGRNRVVKDLPPVLA